MKTIKEHSYEDLRRVLRGSRLNESSRDRVPELEMQARIFAGEFGISWRGMDCENVRVVHFGIWNREPGPDFCRAQVLIEEVEFT